MQPCPACPAFGKAGIMHSVNVSVGVCVCVCVRSCVRATHLGPHNAVNRSTGRGLPCGGVRQHHSQPEGCLPLFAHRSNSLVQGGHVSIFHVIPVTMCSGGIDKHKGVLTRHERREDAGEASGTQRTQNIAGRLHACIHTLYDATQAMHHT